MSLAFLDPVPTYAVSVEQDGTTVPWAMTQSLAEPEPLDSAHLLPGIHLSQKKVPSGPLLEELCPIPLTSLPLPQHPLRQLPTKQTRPLEPQPSTGPWSLVPSFRHKPHCPRLSCTGSHRVLPRHLLYPRTAPHSTPSQCHGSQAGRCHHLERLRWRSTLEEGREESRVCLGRPGSQPPVHAEPRLARCKQGEPSLTL